VTARTVRDRVVFPLVVLVAIVLIWSLPDARFDPADVGYSPVQAYRGVVIAVEPMELDPDDPFAEVEGELLVRLSDEPRAGEEVRAFVNLPFTTASASDFAPGDEVIVTFTEDPAGPAFVGVSERWRLPAIALLVALFAAVIVVVGGWQGFRALLSLAFTIVVVIKLLVPAILDGVAPVPMAAAVAALVTSVTIVVTEGLDRASFAAILGTVAGLAITAMVSVAFGLAAGITGTGAGDLFFVELPSGEGLDTRGIVLAAIIIGAVGVLDDMTVTQAATVHQLAARSAARGRALWSGAMRVGRSHIAATVNTLFLAYVGASLPALIYLVLVAEPALLTLNRELLALEIVRTLVGSLGIVLAMPLTTAIAIALIGHRPVDATMADVGGLAAPRVAPRSIAHRGVRPRAFPTSMDDADRG
jgi:uncharacterized membrane protein